MEKYCIQRSGEKVAVSSTATTTATPTAQRPIAKTAVSEIGLNQWSISGMYLYIAWASANIALILARCSSTTIDQYLKIVVFTNVGLWQLCSRPSRSNEIGAKDTVQAAPERASTSARKGCKPMAGAYRCASYYGRRTRFQPEWSSVANCGCQYHQAVWMYVVMGMGIFQRRKRFPFLENFMSV